MPCPYCDTPLDEYGTCPDCGYEEVEPEPLTDEECAMLHTAAA